MGRSVRRSTADKILTDLIDAAQNANDPRHGFLYAVTKMVVFGSYVNDPEKSLLGDLDIAVELTPVRHVDRSFEDARRDRGFLSGARSFIEAVVWGGEREVVQALRRGHNSLSMHEYDEVIKNGWGHQVLYTHPERERLLLFKPQWV